MAMLAACQTRLLPADSPEELYKRGDFAAISTLANGGDAEAQAYAASMLEEGKGVPQNPERALRWQIAAAEKGNSLAQVNLGIRYFEGNGIERDFTKAAQLYARAIDHNDPRSLATAATNLGRMYEQGQGVAKNLINAHAWCNIAAAVPGGQSADKAKACRSDVEIQMTAEQLSRARDLADRWRPGADVMPLRVMADTERKFPTLPRPGQPPERPRSTGTAFIVDGAGHMITNNHVVDGCVRLTVMLPEGRAPARVVYKSPVVDIAIIEANLPPGPTFARFRSGEPARPGDTVVAIGFPKPGLLGQQTPHVTVGVISAAMGLDDNRRSLQFTAPIQPGNSGGPLLDVGGHVVGVVAAVLKPGLDGDIPQNANFAIQAFEVRKALVESGLTFSEAASTSELKPAAIAAEATGYTFRLECN